MNGLNEQNLLIQINVVNAKRSINCQNEKRKKMIFRYFTLIAKRQALNARKLHCQIPIFFHFPASKKKLVKRLKKWNCSFVI
jgi:hypothetical protein